MANESFFTGTERGAQTAIVGISALTATSSFLNISSSEVVYVSCVGPTDQYSDRSSEACSSSSWTKDPEEQGSALQAAGAE